MDLSRCICRPPLLVNSRQQRSRRWFRIHARLPMGHCSGSRLASCARTCTRNLAGVLGRCSAIAGAAGFELSGLEIRSVTPRSACRSGSAEFWHTTTEVSLRSYRQAKRRRVDEVLLAAGLGERPVDVESSTLQNVLSIDEHRRRATKG